MTTTAVPTIERPARLDDMIGQRAVRARLQILVQGARARGAKVPHVLLSGPAGHGKTTLARIVAGEIGSELVTTSGPALARAGDLAGILCQCKPGAVLFIDEIHRMPTKVEETLYEVMEDGKLSVIVGAGSAARAVVLSLPPITIVGATTKPGALSTPLRDRFGAHLTMQPYSDGDLTEIVERSWDHALVDHEKGAAQVVAERSKGVPRLALHLAARALDVAALEQASITAERAARALEAFGVGRGGLDEVDRRIVVALVTTFAGRAVGLDNLSQAVDVDPTTIQNEHEGALVRAGLVIRTPQGRMATPLAHEWVGEEA